VYHRTAPELAESISTDGFADMSGAYLLPTERSGVWFCSVPPDPGDGSAADTLLEVDLDVPDDELTRYEWVDPRSRRGIREWLVPAAVVTGRARAREMSEDERHAVAAAWRALPRRHRRPAAVQRRRSTFIHQADGTTKVVVR
jgi:hypothetical protein